MSNELKVAGLNYSQDVIKRMAANSFYIKGWCISLLAIVVTILKKDYGGHGGILLSSAMAAIVLLFWGLDAHYLNIERRLRNEYNKKISRTTDEEKAFLTILSDKNEHESFICAFLSRTIILIYLPIITITIAVGMTC